VRNPKNTKFIHACAPYQTPMNVHGIALSPCDIFHQKVFFFFINAIRLRNLAAVRIDSSELDSQRRSTRTHGGIRAISWRKCEILNVSRNFPSRPVKLIANNRFLDSPTTETRHVFRHCRNRNSLITPTCVDYAYTHRTLFRRCNFVAKCMYRYILNLSLISLGVITTKQISPCKRRESHV